MAARAPERSAAGAVLPSGVHTAAQFECLVRHAPALGDDTLIACTAQTLAEFAGNPKWMGLAGGTPAFSLVLHTWTQDLRRHIHLHAVMACGVLDLDGQWHTPAHKPDFLFSVQALSKVFRGKFMAALAAAHKAGKLERDPQGDDQSWRARQHQLYQHAWVVYAKTPLGGLAQVLEYLYRYTHRTAISNERIRSISAHEVAFTVRAEGGGDGGPNHSAKRLLRMQGCEFLRRFMLHILPSGIKRIRHYGVLASSCKAVKLATARAALQIPAPDLRALECAQAFMARVTKLDVGLCPCCGQDRLRVTAVLAGLGRLPAPSGAVLQHNRGPP